MNMIPGVEHRGVETPQKKSINHVSLYFKGIYEINSTGDLELIPVLV